MLGENLRKALADARIPHQEAADKMGISKGSLYNLFKKDSFEVDYLRRASEITGLPINDFFDYNSDILNSKSKEENTPSSLLFGRMSKSLDELKAIFEEEIRAKNQQIAGLQRTVDVLVGKSKGAIDMPVSLHGLTDQQKYDLYCLLGVGTIDQMLVSGKTSLEQNLVAPSSQALRTWH